MDPKRKKIYIIIIIVCFTLSAGILGWTFFGNSGPAPQTQTLDIAVLGQSPSPTDRAGVTPSTGVGQGSSSPSVFPGNTTFRTEVLESEAFKKLNPYTAIDATGQLGRPDPFRSY